MRLFLFYCVVMMFVMIPVTLASIHDTQEKILRGGEDRYLIETNCDTSTAKLECLHNGKCAKSYDEGHQYSDKPLCDCSDAVEVIGSNGMTSVTQRYVGLTCEVPVQFADKCNSFFMGKDLELFCVNGGTCKSTTCDCPTGYTGRHCEYKEEQVSECTLSCGQHGTCVIGINPKHTTAPNDPADLGNQAHRYMHCSCEEGHTGTLCEYGKKEQVSECTLSCGEHGTCVMGTNPKQSTGPYGSLNLGSHQAHEMHCSCEEGRTGILCEYDFVACNVYKNEFCFHGATCNPVYSNSSGISPCVCHTSGLQVAGTYCQYKATDTCTNPVAPTMPLNEAGVVSVKNEHPSSSSFCVNDGVCVEDFDSAKLYCECPDNYDGRQCEHKGELTPEEYNEVQEEEKESLKEDGNDGMSGGMVFVILLLAFAAILASIITVINIRRRRARIIKHYIDGHGDSLGYNIDDDGQAARDGNKYKDEEEEMIEWQKQQQRASSTQKPAARHAPIDNDWTDSCLGVRGETSAYDLS